tara:strand:- start:290 stop:763 length:474 start_codon:yes stop_codon:yes gene_type:complete
MALTKVIGAGIGTVTNQFADANMSAGSIIQNVQNFHTTAVETTTGGTYVDTGLTASITPTSSSSKILITFTVHSFITSSLGAGGLHLVRGSTSLRDFGYGGYFGSTTGQYTNTHQYLDSPSTTSATSYKVQFYTNGYRLICQYSGMVSTMTLQEVAQ